MESLRRKQRSRILIHPNKRYLVMANFKCGFSSLNNAFNLKTDRELIHHIRTPEHLDTWLASSRNRQLLDSCQRVLLARSPYERSLSFFFSWIVNPVKEHREQNNQAHLTLQKAVSPHTYQQLINLIREDQLVTAWRYFVRILPKYYRRDWHTNPQHWLYSSPTITGWHPQKRQVRVNFHHIFKLENLGDPSHPQFHQAQSWFTKWLGSPLPHHYQTQNHPKLYREYFDSQSYQIINRLYHHDFVQLEYQKEQA